MTSQGVCDSDGVTGGNRRALAGLAVLGVLLAALLLITGVWRPFSVRTLTPEGVARLGAGGDPAVVMVYFGWGESGYCPEQFTVTADETASRVVVGQVVNTEPQFSIIRSCAGVGTLNGMAGVPLRLAAPVGDREVRRALDGATLAVQN